MQPEATPCQGWHPGRDSAAGMCECGFSKDDHAKDAKSRASGAPGRVSASDFAYADSPESARPENLSPAQRRVPPDLKYCRNCGQGIVIPETVDADAYQCPRCHKSGPKAAHHGGVGKAEAQATNAEVVKPEPDKTPTQLAYEDGLNGVEPRSKDAAYLDWYDAGVKRRNAPVDLHPANAANDAKVEAAAPAIPAVDPPATPEPTEGES